MFTKDTNVYHSFRTEEASHDANVEGGLGIVRAPDDSSNEEHYEKMPELDGVVAAKIGPLRKDRGNPGDEDDKTDEDENEVGTSESDLERQPFQRDNGQSAGYGQGHIDDDDDSFGDMNQGDFDVGVTGGYYGSLKEMPTRLCEVYSDNIQFKNKKVNELQVRKTV